MLMLKKFMLINSTMLFLRILLYFFSLSLVNSFNFDTDFPIVYTDPASYTSTSHRLSYFGYSVILHDEFEHRKPWIQIGAPRANSSRIPSREPGRIFRCDILGPCHDIDVDTYSGTGHTDRGPFRDKKDGAWIGGTMDLDVWTGRVVVCGHRWVNQRTDYYMEGTCYWSYVNDTVYDKLIPLLEKDKQVVYDRNSRVYLFNYAQGQAGFSAHLVNSKAESELLLGAPGVYNWDGTTIIYKDGPDSIPVASKLQNIRFPTKREAGFAEFSSPNVADAIATTQTVAFGLFGYSVTSGYFFKKNELLYVSGAPRSKSLLGQILVFKFAQTSDQALDVRDSRQGYQYGEYFGASLVAGNINMDEFDDLIVGAPFYTNSKYNEGRIFVFLGSHKGTLEVPQQNSIIEGKGIGGQFGACVMYLGDLHRDGYADIAVGAPYENEGSGVIYIFRGNAQGLDSKPCQRIVGKDFVPNIKGFGISMSKPADVDMNSYSDLAIGAYASGHAVLLRSKPVVTLQQSVISLTPRLDHNAKVFEVKACFGYMGYQAPPSINVTRKIMVDEHLHRAYLPSMIPSLKNIILYKDMATCKNITIFIKRDISDRYSPITVSVSQELIVEENKLQVIYVNSRTNTKQVDKFCKTCPVSNGYRSSKEQTIELSFALGCGNDNICETELKFESTFLNLPAENTYVLGSTDNLKLETIIRNEGEKAYLTQLMVELPESVYFSSIPSNCLEHNGSFSIICNIDNPLYENKEKTLTLNLDMKKVDTGKYGDTLNFTLTVLTSSENRSPNVLTKTLKITREADITLTGKSTQQSYSYGNITYGKANFTQIYQIEKFGASPIEEVYLSVQIPTHMYGKQISVVGLYAPDGVHADQPINCHSDAQYIVENNINGGSEMSLEDGRDFTSDEVTIIDVTTELPRLKRSVGEIKQNFNKQEGAAFINNTNIESEYPANRTFYLNCSNTDVVCSFVNCSIGPFKIKQNIALLRLKMLIDLAPLSKLLGAKDIVILSTDGVIAINNPPDFVQSGFRPDSVRVSSVFIGEIPESQVETWIIIVAIIAGLLLLLLVIMGLTKAGFFQRTKRMELEALKEAEEVEQFKQDSEDFQASEENIKNELSS